MDHSSTSFAFGAGGETSIHPVIACALLLAALLVFTRPRKQIIAPLFAAFFLLPMDQVVRLGPIHLSSLRLVILIGWIRIFATKASSPGEAIIGRANAIDKAVLLLGLTGAANFIILWREWGAVNNQLGWLYTMFGVYFLIRAVIRDHEDVERALRVLATVAVIVAALMVVEIVSGRHPYAFLGSSFRDASVRDDRVRAVGPFQTPILAGTFGSTSLPLFLGLWWWRRNNRVLAVAGVVGATAIMVTSGSSTPLMAYSAAVIGLCLWPLRRHMRVVRWGILLSLIPIQLSMQNPIWHAIGRLDVFGGNAWHREMLVDNFVRRFGEWWLFGTKNTPNWGWDMWDLDNQFVWIGALNGLLPLLCFFAILVYLFKWVGKGLKASHGKTSEERFFWALGVTVFSHIAAFLGICYFDQTMVAWYALLVITCVMADPKNIAAVQLNRPAEFGAQHSEWWLDSSTTPVKSDPELNPVW